MRPTRSGGVDSGILEKLEEWFMRDDVQQFMQVEGLNISDVVDASPAPKSMRS